MPPRVTFDPSQPPLRFRRYEGRTPEERRAEDFRFARENRRRVREMLAETGDRLAADATPPPRKSREEIIAELRAWEERRQARQAEAAKSEGDPGPSIVIDRPGREDRDA